MPDPTPPDDHAEIITARVTGSALAALAHVATVVMLVVLLFRGSGPISLPLLPGDAGATQVEKTGLYLLERILEEVVKLSSGVVPTPVPTPPKPVPNPTPTPPPAPLPSLQARFAVLILPSAMTAAMADMRVSRTLRANIAAAHMIFASYTPDETEVMKPEWVAAIAERNPPAIFFITKDHKLISSAAAPDEPHVLVALEALGK